MWARAKTKCEVGTQNDADSDNAMLQLSELVTGMGRNRF